MARGRRTARFLSLLCLICFCSACPKYWLPPDARYRPQPSPATDQSGPAAAARRQPTRRQAVVAQPASVPVSYILASVVSEEDDDVSVLDDGSRWSGLSCNYDDVLIVVTSNSSGTAFCGGTESYASFISGVPYIRSGTLTMVQAATENGEFLRLIDGSSYEVDSYDQYHTSFWMPPYAVVVLANDALYNLDRGKKIDGHFR